MLDEVKRKSVVGAMMDWEIGSEFEGTPVYLGFDCGKNAREKFVSGSYKKKLFLIEKKRAVMSCILDPTEVELTVMILNDRGIWLHNILLQKSCFFPR